jgi:hypothetical protein
MEYTIWASPSYSASAIQPASSSSASLALFAERGLPLLLLPSVTLNGEEEDKADEDARGTNAEAAGAGGGGCLARVDKRLLREGMTSSPSSSSTYSSLSVSSSRGEDVEKSLFADRDILARLDLGAGAVGGVDCRRLAVDRCRIGRPEGER